MKISSVTGSAASILGHSRSVKPNAFRFWQWFVYNSCGLPCKKNALTLHIYIQGFETSFRYLSWGFKQQRLQNNCRRHWYIHSSAGRRWWRHTCNSNFKQSLHFIRKCTLWCPSTTNNHTPRTNGTWYLGTQDGVTLHWNQSRHKHAVHLDPSTNTPSFCTAPRSLDYW